MAGHVPAGGVPGPPGCGGVPVGEARGSQIPACRWPPGGRSAGGLAPPPAWQEAGVAVPWPLPGKRQSQKVGCMRSTTNSPSSGTGRVTTLPWGQRCLAGGWAGCHWCPCPSGPGASGRPSGDMTSARAALMGVCGLGVGRPGEGEEGLVAVETYQRGRWKPGCMGSSSVVLPRSWSGVCGCWRYRALAGHSAAMCPRPVHTGQR